MRSAALACIALAGCTPAADLRADDGARFDPVAFFAGRSAGEAVLHKLVGKAVPVRVVSRGRRDARGGLVLDQTIREGSKPARQRRWVMRPVGPDRFTGALTDAAGPVDISVAGPRATIRYRMKNGLGVEQQLALQKDRRTLLNRLSVSKWGIRIAQLDETIRKLD